LWHGEFASHTASIHTDADPAAWTRILVQLAEAENISWSYFGLLGVWDAATDSILLENLWDPVLDVWNEPILEALHPEPIEPWADCEAAMTEGV
jgi:hypothetical protein